MVIEFQTESIKAIDEMLINDHYVKIDSFLEKQNHSDFQKKRDFLRICSIERDKQKIIIKNKESRINKERVPEVRKTIG